MFQEGQFVVYKRDVCKIREKKNINNIFYYVLNPIDDNSLTITVPHSKLIRTIISKEESDKLISSISNIDIVKIHDKLIENEYKNLLNSGNLEDLVKIIKTTYLRNKARLDNHKKIGEKDDNYFKKAERLLYNEISISLGLSYDETKNYITKRVEDLLK